MDSLNKTQTHRHIDTYAKSENSSCRAGGAEVEEDCKCVADPVRVLSVPWVLPPAFGDRAAVRDS